MIYSQYHAWWWLGFLPDQGKPWYRQNQPDISRFQNPKLQFILFLTYASSQQKLFDCLSMRSQDRRSAWYYKLLEVALLHANNLFHLEGESSFDSGKSDNVIRLIRRNIKRAFEKHLYGWCLVTGLSVTNDSLDINEAISPEYRSKADSNHTELWR